MFFDPHDYLERDPATAQTKVEAERLVREAGQRAELCRTMAKVAAERGFEGTGIYRVVGTAGLGSLTFYKLYESKEACLLEAFERCSEAIFARVEEAVRNGGVDFAQQVEAGLRELLELLAAEPDVARVVLVEIRVGGTACREAQQRELRRFGQLLELGCAARRCGPKEKETARMVVGAIAGFLTSEVSAGTPIDLGRVLPELSFIALAPYLGVEGAATEMRRRQEELIRSGGKVDGGVQI